MNPNPDPPTNARRGPVSSLFDKLSPSLRAQIDDAIIRRDPPRLIDLYHLFQLPISGVGIAAFYRYASRLRATASLDHFARLARADGRDPIESMSTVLDAEFIRIATADGSIPDDDRVDADPYAIEEAALKRLHRIVLMRQRLAATRLSAERAATHREDAERRRNDKSANEFAAALHTVTAAEFARSRRPAESGNDGTRSPERNPATHHNDAPDHPTAPQPK